MLATIAKRVSAASIAVATAIALSTAQAATATSNIHKITPAQKPADPVAFYGSQWPNLVDVYGIYYTYSGRQNGVDYWHDNYWGYFWVGVGLTPFSNGTPANVSPTLNC